MSYLSALRLHFAGRFQASVSTVNNSVTHFKNEAFCASYQESQTGGSWNPRGDAAWRFIGCKVTAAFDKNGKPAHSNDPIMQMIVADSDAQVTAKLVDLDPQQQM